MRKSLFLAALLAMTGAAAAKDDALILTGNKLRETVSGRNIYLMTPIGSEVLIRYRPNGTMQGVSSTHLAALAGERVSTDHGRWWVANEQLCQQWKNWSERRSHCYKLQTAGNAVRWHRNDGETGTARIGR